MHANAIWIDVRTPQEFADGHLPQAVNIPHDQIADKISSLAADKGQPIRLYCRTGRRSGLALQVLQQMGYTDVQNLGGYEDLKHAGQTAM